jgi:hypothetical protein
VSVEGEGEGEEGRETNLAVVAVADAADEEFELVFVGD